jgi:hypothetical protein
MPYPYREYLDSALPFGAQSQGSSASGKSVQVSVLEEFRKEGFPVSELNTEHSFCPRSFKTS